MEIIERDLNGVFEIKPRIIGDARGYFCETYRAATFEEHGLQTTWVQDNQSFTKETGTIRGLHFQSPPTAQTKLIRVPQGRILDVFVDIRVGSASYGKWSAAEISAEKGNAIYIPKGFAHGFCTLECDTIVQYKVDDYYSKEDEGGIRWDDEELSVDWKVESPRLSEKDKILPRLSEIESPFVYRN